MRAAEFLKRSLDHFGVLSTQQISRLIVYKIKSKQGSKK